VRHGLGHPLSCCLSLLVCARLCSTACLQQLHVKQPPVSPGNLNLWLSPFQMPSLLPHVLPFVPTNYSLKRRKQDIKSPLADLCPLQIYCCSAISSHNRLALSVCVQHCAVTVVSAFRESMPQAPENSCLVN